MTNTDPSKEPIESLSQHSAYSGKWRLQNRFHHWTARGIFSLHTFDAFQYRNYRFLWASALSVGGGYWLQQVVVGWLIYDITHSALLTSIALGLEAIPLLIAGPIGGFLVDVFDRRKLLVTICLYHGSLALALGIGLQFREIGPLEIFLYSEKSHQCDLRVHVK